MLRPFLALSVIVVGIAGAAKAEPWQRYASLLERHTRETSDLAQTRVDYEALRGAPEWSAFLAELEQVDPSGLASRAERLAFWINAYNAFAIDVVVKGNPEQSIRDLGTRFLAPVWDKPAGRLAGRSYSLGQIEHEILRPMGDPRIHGAIVCASLSCPPLARTPYRAETLEADLTRNLERWIAHPGKGVRVDREARTLQLSKIFDWFEDDFEKSGGVVAFVARYARVEDRPWLAREGPNARLRYLDYDWTLNRLR